MLIRLKKADFFCKFLVVLIALSLNISPCQCFAADSTEQSQNSHSCCDETGKNKTSHDKHQCGSDGCECVLNSAELVVEHALVSSNQTEEESGDFFSFGFIDPPRTDYGALNSKRIKSLFSPPGIPITTSSTLAKLLHRWLV